MDLLYIVLGLYSALVVFVILILIFLVARFYQLKSGQEVYHRAFLLPPFLLLFGIAVPVLWPGSLVITVLADILLWAAGLLLVILNQWLFFAMTGGKK